MRLNTEKFRQARTAKGLTQTELARQSGIEQSHISYIERGVKGVSWEMLEKVAKALGVDPQELCFDVTEAKAHRHVAAGYSVLNFIRADDKVPRGLKDLANDRDLVQSLNITEDEWMALVTIKLPAAVNKDGYMHLVLTVRAICG